MLLRDRDRRDLPIPLADISSEHRFAVRVLALIEHEVQALETGRRADTRLLREALHFFENVMDKVHHPREDLIFDRMERSDPATRQITDDLRGGHDQIATIGIGLLRKLSVPTPVEGKFEGKFLAEELSRYCAGMRQHMRAEETGVYEPARQLLTDKDWKEIERKLNSLPNAICGVDEAPEYSWLLNRYLNRVAVYSSGGLPYAWVDNAASVVERGAHTSAELFRLPGRLIRLAGRKFPNVVRKIIAVRSISDAVSAAGSVSASVAEAGRATLMMMRDSVRAPGTYSDDSETGAQVQNLQTDDELSTFGEKRETAKEGSAISWQAAGAAVLFRTTLKPILGRSALNLAAWMRRRTHLSYRVPAGYEVETVAGAGFKGRHIRRQKTERRTKTILYLHGGAFVFPAANGHTMALTYLGDRCKAEGLMVDYRLLPEHPFPAALDDCIAAYRYLLDSGVESRDIAVAGDSAGGGLTLSLLFALRDANLPMPACAAGLSLFGDLSFSGPSHEFNRWSDSVLPAPLSASALQDYANGVALDDPRISPVYGDFTGLPPLFIQASSTEILLDDSLRVARKARAQGVEVQLELWDSLPHAWHVFSFIPESRAALRNVARFFERQFEVRSGLQPRDDFDTADEDATHA